MIQPTTLKFLRNLKTNNNKPWFDENRAAYGSARQNFLDFTQELIYGLSAIDGNIANAFPEAKHCVMRINRDIRFSQDKSPYKTNFAAVISQGGKKSNFACYYLHFEPDNCFAGGGAYLPMPPDLLKFRQAIDHNFDNWKAIVESKNFTKVFSEGVQTTDSLARPPKGFDANSPAVEYLKMKGYFAAKQFSNEEMQAKSAVKSVLQSFETLSLLVNFLNNAL